MKAITLVAVIGICLQVLASIYYQLINHNIIEPDRTLTDIVGPFFLIGNIALLIFFIRLYQKQSN